MVWDGGESGLQGRPPVGFPWAWAIGELAQGRPPPSCGGLPQARVLLQVLSAPSSASVNHDRLSASISLSIFKKIFYVKK